MNHKKILTGIAAAAAVALGFTACSEDVEVNNGNTNANESFSIGVTVKQGWDEPQATRAARYADYAAKLQAAGGKEITNFNGTIEGKPIYLLLTNAIDGFGGKGQNITIETAVETEEEETRGTLMNGHDGSEERGKEHFVKSTFYDNFNIYGDKAASGTIANHKAGTPNDWTLTKKFTWSDDNSYTFHAIAPANCSLVSNASQTGFTVTTPTDSRQQMDVMAATKTASRADREVLFGFEHVMSAVGFKLGGDFLKHYTIKKIEISGVKTTGTYHFGSSDGSWTLTDTKKTVFVDDLGFSTTDGANKEITSDEPKAGETAGTTFILLPQELGGVEANVIFTVVADGTSNEECFYASMAGQVWQKGYKYIYTISNTPKSANLTFTVETDPIFTYAAKPTNSNIFKVTSYRQESATETPEALPWEIVGYLASDEYTPQSTAAAETNGSKVTYPSSTWTTEAPAWLTSIIPESTAGGFTPNNVTTAVATSRSMTTQRQENRLRENPTKGTEAEPFDLSMYKVDNTTTWSGRTTANCYIVRQGGHYKIPLVMGNTYKNGALWTPDQYVPDLVGTAWIKGVPRSNSNNSDLITNRTHHYRWGQKTFIDYKGELVTQENYKIQGAVTAEVLWHDFQDTASGEEKTGVITIPANPITAEGDLSFLNFSVDKDKIQQGNAVIVVKNSDGEIMWSWHIYITDDDWTKTVTLIPNDETQTVKKFPISKYNLGYVEKFLKGNHTWCARQVQVKIRQVGTNNEKIVTITQQGQYFNASQNYDWDTKYQWGRKDAMPGVVEVKSPPLGSSASPTTIYYPQGGFLKNTTLNAYSWRVTNGAGYAMAIQEPWKRFAVGITNQQYADGDQYGEKYIKNGETYYCYQDSWSDALYVNAWNATRTKITTNMKGGRYNYYGTSDYAGEVSGMFETHIDYSNVVKTIYDPCPAGFKVPPSGAFTGFTKTGGNVGLTTATQSQMPDNAYVAGTFAAPTEGYQPKGWAFYVNKTNSGETVFFPATGRSANAGVGTSWGGNIYLWSATPTIPGYHDKTNKEAPAATPCGTHLSCSAIQVRPLQQNQQVMPHSIRPMTDD
ncbi:MAG: fimbrillin family protein [Prevotella sp.]|nr:fimbrillin family protein [Prevotella sp.]